MNRFLFFSMLGDLDKTFSGFHSVLPCTFSNHICCFFCWFLYYHQRFPIGTPDMKLSCYTCKFSTTAIKTQQLQQQLKRPTQQLQQLQQLQQQLKQRLKVQLQQQLKQQLNNYNNNWNNNSTIKTTIKITIQQLQQQLKRPTQQLQQQLWNNASKNAIKILRFFLTCSNVWNNISGLENYLRAGIF